MNDYYDQKIQNQLDGLNPHYLFIARFFGIQTFSYIDMGETVNRRYLTVSDEYINKAKKKFVNRDPSKSLQGTSYNES